MSLVNAFSKDSTSYVLSIKKKNLFGKRSFIVLDAFNKKKYNIKTDMISFGYPCIRLYDVEENEIGNVELASKVGLGTYTVSLGGKKLGTISRKLSAKLKMEISFNGWRLDEDIIQSTFIVTDKNGNRVMKFNSTQSIYDTCVLEINNREHEIMGLLLVMVIKIAS